MDWFKSEWMKKLANELGYSELPKDLEDRANVLYEQGLYVWQASEDIRKYLSV